MFAVDFESTHSFNLCLLSHWTVMELVAGKKNDKMDYKMLKILCWITSLFLLRYFHNTQVCSNRRGKHKSVPGICEAKKCSAEHCKWFLSAMFDSFKGTSQLRSIYQSSWTSRSQVAHCKQFEQMILMLFIWNGAYLRLFCSNMLTVEILL